MTAPAIGPIDRGLRATFYREYLTLTRNRTNLLLAVVPTAVYLLLFATSLTNLIGDIDYQGTTVTYAEFTIPAIMLSSMLAAATTTGTALFQEELGGMALEIWSYPLRRRSYIAGKLVASSTLVLVQSLAALVVAVLVFRVGWSAAHWAALLAGTLVASVALNSMYLLMATLIRDFQRFMVLINVLGPTLLFASPSFYPVERMPVALQWATLVNPVTYGVNCLRDAALFGFTAMWPWALVLAAAAALMLGAISRALVHRAREL